MESSALATTLDSLPLLAMVKTSFLEMAVTDLGSSLLLVALAAAASRIDASSPGGGPAQPRSFASL